MLSDLVLVIYSPESFGKDLDFYWRLTIVSMELFTDFFEYNSYFILREIVRISQFPSVIVKEIQ